MSYKNSLAVKLLLNPDIKQYAHIIDVIVPLLTLNQKVRFATKCARSVLHIFEEKYPDDKRPVDCLDFLDSVEDFGSLTKEQKGILSKHRNAANAAADANKQEQQLKNLQFLREVING